ncbi:2-hydroxyacid dehydrogenase [Chitinophaga sp. CF418]|uniref:2-hydroxyacid dehydrogenase n=1 Tax=Chitinophaga sp. CF418 TaxID=1855287 RepID=UPI0009205447|nr:2-hydroxyacid dehydrogenase [Chitinophaga sp. CF418]SHN34250.1 D-lactate dehydrogenase [Chitinophaga sp. CF418]
METVIFSTHNFEKCFLEKANSGKHKLKFLDVPLNMTTADLANGATAVSIFVNDDAGAEVLNKLQKDGVKFLVLRSAGYNNVDMGVARRSGFKVARVPAYSPYAVAEHAIALMMALNRKLIKANTRVHDLNFSLDGLTGFDMNGKTVGIIGTGQIGAVAAKILNGFGCKILSTDLQENRELIEKYNVHYTKLDNLYTQSDIISLHIPLTPRTRYIINKDSIDKMKKGVMIINTSRGALINTKDIIQGLKKGQIGYLGLDVYEEESGLFFEDHSEDILQDDMISRLLTFKNVLITSHQAFLTDTALQNIAMTTIYNLDCFENNGICKNEIN